MAGGGCVRFYGRQSKPASIMICPVVKVFPVGVIHYFRVSVVNINANPTIMVVWPFLSVFTVGTLL